MRFHQILLMLLTGSIVLLSACSTGCTTIKYVDKPTPVYITPSEALLQTESAPIFTGRYNKDLVDYVIELRQIISRLNARIDGIKNFCDKSTKSVE